MKRKCGYLNVKVNFLRRKIYRTKERQSTMIKGSVYSKDLTVLNMVASQNRASKYKKKVSED